MTDDTPYFYQKPPHFSRTWQPPNQPFKVPKWVKEQIEKDYEKEHIEQFGEVIKEYEDEIKKLNDQITDMATEEEHLRSEIEELKEGKL